MNGKVLDVRKVGFPGNTSDSRSPESFAFPASLTSLMECIGEDVRWETIQAHGREWTQRLMYKDILAASGMGFGLLWRNDLCPSSFDLTQVHADHNDTICRGFAYVGYECEVIERIDDNEAALWAKITSEIDAGRPVLAFGIVGPPECCIIAGYDADKKALRGWSHFQSHDPAHCAENGMFLSSGWHANLWKTVVCGPKRDARTSLKDVVRQGVEIMERNTVAGDPAKCSSEPSTLLMGFAAYDAWIAFVQDPAFETMDDATLKGKHWYHTTLVGSHAELRCYLGNFLAGQVTGQNAEADKHLQEAARCLLEIHDQCWKLWGVLGGMGAPDAWQGLRDAAKRAELAAVLTHIKTLDRQAADALHAWVSAVRVRTIREPL